VPTLTVTISVTQDGLGPLPGFPLTRRVSVDEVQSFAVEQANAANTTTWQALPLNLMDTVTFLVVRTDRAVTFRLNDGTADATTLPSIALSAGGVLVIADGTLRAGAGASNARSSNNSGATAVLRGVGGGT